MEPIYPLPNEGTEFIIAGLLIRWLSDTRKMVDYKKQQVSIINLLSLNIFPPNHFMIILLYLTRYFIIRPT